MTFPASAQLGPLCSLLVTRLDTGKGAVQQGYRPRGAADLQAAIGSMDGVSAWHVRRRGAPRVA